MGRSVSGLEPGVDLPTPADHRAAAHPGPGLLR